MRIFKKACGIIVGVLLWGTLAICVLLMVITVAAKASGKQPTFFGLGIYQIVSGSMEPEIKVGDVIIGKKADPKAVKVGDNLIFNYGKIIITHKVIAINPDGTFTTHGSANPEGSNETVTPSQVIATQIFQLKGFGVVLNFLRSPFGFLLVIALPIGGLIIYQTITLTKRLKEYKSAKSSQNNAPPPNTPETQALKQEIATLKQKLSNKDKK